MTQRHENTSSQGQSTTFIVDFPRTSLELSAVANLSLSTSFAKGSTPVVSLPLQELSKKTSIACGPDGCVLLPLQAINSDTGSNIQSSPSARKGTFSQLRSQLSFLKKQKAKWNNPEASVGAYCGLKGNYSVWEGNGPVREIFKTLGPQISTLLNRSCGPVPSSSQVIFDVFMIGVAPASSIPHIMFSCRKSGPRKTAMETLEKSSLLKRHPGFETGNWQFPPHIMDPRLLASDRETADEFAIDVANLHFIPLSGFEAPHLPWTTKITAIQLYTNGPVIGVDNPLRSTVGGIVSFIGQRFFITVAHTFSGQNPRLQHPSDESDDGDEEFEFGGFKNDDREEYDEDSELTSGGSMTSESTVSEADFNGDASADVESENLNFSSPDLLSRTTTRTSGLLIYPSDNDEEGNFEGTIQDSIQTQGESTSTVIIPRITFLHSYDLDYTLIEVKECVDQVAIDHLPILSWQTAAGLPSEDVRIVTVTGSTGLISGTLNCGISYISLLSSSKFQETLTVTLDGPLQPGDSGSLILCANTGKIYGYIVAGSIDSQIAYIIPAINVLKDLELVEEGKARARNVLRSNSPDRVLGRGNRSELDNEDMLSWLQNSDRLNVDLVDPAISDNQVDVQMASFSYQPYGGSSPQLTPPSNPMIGESHYDISYHDWSDVESIFSENESIASSQSSVSDFHFGALAELVDLFLHSDLQQLYTPAISKVGPEKFTRNFRRFLLRYGRKLQYEASNPLEFQAAKLVRVSARQVAMEIKELVEPGTASSALKKRGGMDPVQLNEWLESVKGREEEKEGEFSDASDSDESEIPEHSQLRALEEVKAFMISGQAFTDLCETFRQWLKLDDQQETNAIVSPPESRDESNDESVDVEDLVSATGLQPPAWVSELHESALDIQQQRRSGIQEREITTELLRKQSGELLRPALRAPKPKRRPSTMPFTSTYSKGVHFDSNLEHVREFLQVDRPFAVSRGDPVEPYESDTEFPFTDESSKPRKKYPVERYDAYDSDTEFFLADEISKPKKYPIEPFDRYDSDPESPFADKASKLKTKVKTPHPSVEEYDSDDFPFSPTIMNDRHTTWELILSNFPYPTAERLKQEVRMEEIYLLADEKCLVGDLLVANIGFKKEVICRFTLDYWQTTGELIAEYDAERQKNKPDGYDRYTFKLLLFEHYSLEAKTLFFCVKYMVNGQEYWDNNGRTNFQVDFRSKTRHLSKRDSLSMLRRRKYKLDHDEIGSASRSNRYDFSASLAAAIKQANAVLGRSAAGDKIE